MQISSSAAMFSMFWITLTVALGVALDVGSWGSWLILAAVALFPPVAMARLMWYGPEPTLSQDIQKALRQRP